MSGVNFCLSTVEKDHCYQPLVCETNKGHLVVWGYGVEKSKSEFWVTAFEGKFQGINTKLADVDDTTSLVFLKRFNHNSYVLLTETKSGFEAYILDDNGTIVCKHVINTEYVLIDVYGNRDFTTLFLYNYRNMEASVATVPNGSPWVEMIIHHTYKDVWSFPVVFHDKKNYYNIAYVDNSDHLQIVSASVLDPIEGTPITINNYYVDYLLGARISDNCFVVGGYYKNDKTMRLDYVCGTKIYNRYLRCNDYENHAFSFVSLNQGFMLLAEGGKNTIIRGQRFTHLGTPLYQMFPLAGKLIQTHSPTMAQGENYTLITYIKDYGTFSQVWGKWVDINILPELENMTFEEIQFKKKD